MKKVIFILFLFLNCIFIYAQDEADIISEPYSAESYQERIIRFHSDILIDTLGKIRVSEHIKVFSNGDEIKRGIVRRIPIYRKDKYGKKRKVDITVFSVLCNEKEENYRVENSDGNKEIYVGNKDVFLESGIYDYVITYESSGQIGFFDDFDELYWNVTGNEWDFPIEKASAAIILPEEVHSMNTACYTGVSGSTQTDCSVEVKDSLVTFTANSSLAIKEGFTVAVSFTPHIIRRPPPPSKAELIWDDYKEHISAFLSLLLMGIFCFFTWLKVGKDPEKPVVVPTFNPPHDWSPAIVRYLYKKKYDDKIFTATLVGMAVKKALCIQDEGKKYQLKATDNKENLTDEEKEIYNILFSKSQTLAVSDKNYSKFSKVSSKLTKSLQSKWNIKDYFHANIKYAVFAAIIASVLLILYGIIAKAGSIIMLMFSIPFVVIGVVCIVAGIKEKTGGVVARIFMIMFGIMFAVPVFFGQVIVSFYDSWINGLFTTLMLTGTGLYIYLIKAPTELGAKTASELEGFKMYLQTAEEHRLNILTPPEKTPELFEKLLPYAIALDVENDWSRKFDDVLQLANYVPEWYTGNNPITISGMSHSFTSSVSSAGVNPSSSSSSSSGGSWSSGNSGGGSSGGGGGGGGGGGW